MSSPRQNKRDIETELRKVDVYDVIKNNKKAESCTHRLSPPILLLSNIHKEGKGAGAKFRLLGKLAGTMTKSSVSQDEFLLLPPPPTESFSKKPGESWVGEVSALARFCWISPRDCCMLKEKLLLLLDMFLILFDSQGFNSF